MKKIIAFAFLAFFVAAASLRAETTVLITPMALDSYRDFCVSFLGNFHGRLVGGKKRHYWVGILGGKETARGAILGVMFMELRSEAPVHTVAEISGNFRTIEEEKKSAKFLALSAYCLLVAYDLYQDLPKDKDLNLKSRWPWHISQNRRQR